LEKWQKFLLKSRRGQRYKDDPGARKLHLQEAIILFGKREHKRPTEIKGPSDYYKRWLATPKALTVIMDPQREMEDYISKLSKLYMETNPYTKFVKKAHRYFTKKEEKELVEEYKKTRKKLIRAYKRQV